MSKLSNIKFQKFDDFKNPVFICSPREESENYYTLEKIANNITKKHPDIFSPVYHSQEHLYCSIRFKKNSAFKQPQEHCFYDIEYKIMKKQKDDKTSSSYSTRDNQREGDSVEVRARILFSFTVER